MRRVLLLVALLGTHLLSTAQAKLPVSHHYKTSNGKYTISYYADNIIKLSYTPAFYKTNENLSDAVLLKPKPIQPPVKVKVNGDIVSFNGKAILVNADTAAGFHVFNFALENGERIYGGGERALPLDRRGYKFQLYNNPWYGYGENADNLNYSVPFFTSSKGYGLFFDNPSKGYADIGKGEESIFQVGFSSGELNVFVILGNNYQEVLESYHRLTGRQPLPPRWAFGNLMSRFGYTSEAQVMDILGKMKAEKIPVDAVIFDLFWFGDSIKGTLGNLDWVNKEKWPNPGKMIRGLEKDGIKTILVTEPFFLETARNYTAAKPFLAVDSNRKPYYLTDFYFGKGGLIDIFRKDAKDWFWSFYKKQVDLGVEAWWGDLGEPEKHPVDMYHNLSDQGHKRLFAADEVHNIYGHNWTKMLHDKYAVHYPNKRLFSLNRSGFAGSQRFGIFPWTGDVSRSWSGLRAQLPILLGMAMSGVPYVHSDAGGFAGGEGDNELYVRWLQFATFTPIFRPHGTALYEVEPQAFSFPSEAALIDTPWRYHAKDAIDFRYALLPYNYSLGYLQAKQGKPLMAPLYYYYDQDSIAFGIQNQYMWGENLMVAPVLEKNIQQMQVYLPKGRWLPFGGKVVQGGGWINTPVTIHSIPVFLKEGAFLPQVIYDHQANEIANTSAYRQQYRSLTYFPSKNKTEFSWFEDDGSSKNSIATGNFSLVRCKGVETDQEIRVDLVSNNTRYLPAAFDLMVAGMTHKPKRLLVNGKPIPIETIDNAEEVIVEEKTQEYAVWSSANELLLVKLKGKQLNIIIRVYK